MLKNKQTGIINEFPIHPNNSPKKDSAIKKIVNSVREFFRRPKEPIVLNNGTRITHGNLICRGTGTEMPSHVVVEGLK